MWMSFTGKTWDNTWISFLHERNQFQTSIKFSFSSKVELMLLAILNGLKSFRWYFLMFANDWIYWKVELLQNVNLKRNNNCYWYVKCLILLSTGNSLHYILIQPFSTACKHHYKTISQGNGKFVAYTPYLKCNVHNMLIGLKRCMWEYLLTVSLIC